MVLVPTDKSNLCACGYQILRWYSHIHVGPVKRDFGASTSDSSQITTRMGLSRVKKRPLLLGTLMTSFLVPLLPDLFIRWLWVWWSQTGLCKLQSFYLKSMAASSRSESVKSDILGLGCTFTDCLEAQNCFCTGSTARGHIRPVASAMYSWYPGDTFWDMPVLLYIGQCIRKK